MREFARIQSELQRKCVHPDGGFVPFETAPDDSVVGRFEAQVAGRPDRTAIRTLRRKMSYGELNALANGIGRKCQGFGLDDQRVVLVLDHDELAVAAILGILKAGGTYVPVDPSYPPRRIGYVVDESQAGLLLTNTRNLPVVRRMGNERLKIVNIDEIDIDAAEQNLELPTAPESLASIYYTSGSTGHPKGVMETHANRLVNVGRCTNCLHISRNDTLTLLYGVAFAASVTDIFCALLNGASLFVHDLKQEGIAGLPQALGRHEVTIYHSAPAVFRQLANALPPGNGLPLLRLVRLASESVRTDDLDLYRRKFPHRCLLANTWAATEGPFFRPALFDHGTELPDDAIPIVGHPIDDDELSLRDEHDAEIPLGTTGEIVVRSRYLSPGYWGRPELTKRRLQPDPDDPSRRVYRTGDLGQFLPDGRLVYRGRTELRTKIRGYLVELREVELALQGEMGIDDAVVVVREDVPGDKRLVAYVAPKEAPHAAELRRSLGESLPAYMVPSTFVALDELPRTPSGKVDRDRLPDPGCGRPELEGAYVAPRTHIERTLVTIWESVLGVRPVGIRDDLFDIGGTSLAAAQLAAEVEKAFGIRVDLSTFLRSPTVERFALDVHRQCPTDCAGTVPLQSLGSSPPVFFICGTTLYRDLARHLGVDRPAYATLLAVEADLARPRRAGRFPSVEGMAAAYMREIRMVFPEGPYLLAGVSFGGVLAFEIARQLENAGKKVDLVALFDSRLSSIARRAPLRWIRHHLTESMRVEPRRMLEQVGCRIRYRVNRASRILEPWFGKRSDRDTSATQTEAPAFQAARREIYRKALRNYVPGPYPGKVILFRAQDALRGNGYGTEPSLGWAAVACPALEIHDVPGDHLGMLTEPHVRALGEKLRSCLETTACGK